MIKDLEVLIEHLLEHRSCINSLSNTVITIKASEKRFISYLLSYDHHDITEILLSYDHHDITEILLSYDHHDITEILLSYDATI